MNSKKIRSNARSAFTLIELLTVVAIIGLLAAILVPVVGKARNASHRAKCSSNVRQICMALLNLANQDRQQRFPGPGGSGFLPWDMQDLRTSSTEALKLTNQDLANLAGRNMLVCPGAKPMNGDEQWKTFDYVPIDYLILTGSGSYVPNGVLSHWVSDRLRSEYTYTVASISYSVPPSKREMVVDAVLTSGGRSGSGWDSPTAIMGKRTNHVHNNMAEGANVGFVDGHVAWRTADEIMKIGANRTNVFSSGGNSLIFRW